MNALQGKEDRQDPNTPFKSLQKFTKLQGDKTLIYIPKNNEQVFISTI